MKALVLKRSYFYNLCVHARSVAQLCPLLWDTVDHSPPDSSAHGILQARILEWVSMPSSGGSSRSRERTHISYISPALVSPGKPLCNLYILPKPKKMDVDSRGGCACERKAKDIGRLMAFSALCCEPNAALNKLN